MPAYAVAHMRQVAMGQPIVEYLERIDATLAPFVAGSSCTAATSRSWKAVGLAR
ncbi:MAG: hypothetical protein ACRDMI_01455 [Streptosporangiaceae bacterium]